MNHLFDVVYLKDNRKHKINETVFVKVKYRVLFERVMFTWICN